MTGVERFPTNGSETVFTAHLSNIGFSLVSVMGNKRENDLENKDYSAEAVIYRPIRTMNTAGAIIPISGTKICGKKFTAKSLVI